MTTLKKYLNENKISISDTQRFDLGYKVARLWDKELQGKKTYVIEDDFKVRHYPEKFLNSKSCSKLIIDYLSYDFNKLSNSF